MADPTVTLLASANDQTTATTTVSFTAQAAGTLLVLQYGGDDYRTTSGSGRPESTGWTLFPTGGDQRTFLGHAAWYKIATGAETSVQYTIGSASPSCYQLIAADNIDTTTPVDITNGALVQSSSNSYTTPSVATSAGRRLAIGLIGGSLNSTLGAMSSWTNGYTGLGSALQNTASTHDVIGSSYLVLDGGVSTSTGATYNQVVQARTGIIGVFKVSSGGGAPALPPPLIMQTRRAY